MLLQYKNKLSANRLYRVFKRTPTVLEIITIQVLIVQEFVKHSEEYGLSILSESWGFTPVDPPAARLKTFKHKH